MQRVGPLPPQQHMAEKHQQITANSLLGKTKVERLDFALPHNLTLPIFYLCTVYGIFQAGGCVDTAEHHFWLTFDEGVTNLNSIKRI